MSKTFAEFFADQHNTLDRIEKQFDLIREDLKAIRAEVKGVVRRRNG